jgi:hypothetical protein
MVARVSSPRLVKGVKEVKGPENEPDHSPPFGAQITKAWCYSFTSLYVFITWSPR